MPSRLPLTRAARRRQVRVYEKARDDYGQRFNDAGLREACVADMLRGRAVTEDGGQMEAVLKLLSHEPFCVQIAGEGDSLSVVESGGERVTLERVRTKNKCKAKAVGTLSPDSLA